jgi:excisionase family DNA binding protein
MYMMDAVTIREACDILHKSEKQVRRYIHAGMLDAAIVGRQYFITRASVEALAKQPPAQIDMTLARRVDQIELQLASMQTTLMSMQQLLDTVSSQKAQMPVEAPGRVEILPTPKDTTLSTQTPPAPSQHELLNVSDVGSSPDDFPPGTLTLPQFADRLHIDRTTLVGHCRDGKKQIEHIAVPKPGREGLGEMERYFTPEQQKSFISWHIAHSKRRGK